MPPGWRQTQLGGFVHYPTRSGSGRAKHPQEKCDDGHMSQTADPVGLDNPQRAV